jgi:hypothetical protein
MTGIDLTLVDGLDALSVQTILSETGIDMKPWRTVKHFTSWLLLSPNNKITGGKLKVKVHNPPRIELVPHSGLLHRAWLTVIALWELSIAVCALNTVHQKLLLLQLINWFALFTSCSRTENLTMIRGLIIMKLNIVIELSVIYVAKLLNLVTSWSRLT